MSEKPLITRRAMLKVAATATASALLAACAPKVEAPEAEMEAETEAEAPPAAVTGTVTIMHFRHELTEDQEVQFEGENSGIQIEFVDADQTRFFAMYAAGTPPDLYRLQAPSIPQMLARRLMYDLTPYFEKSQLVKLDDLAAANDYYKAESPLEIGKGKIYGMCKDFSPDFTVFANKAMFEKAGLPVPDDTKAMTYQEVMDAAKKLTTFEGDRMLTLGYAYEGGWIDRIWMNMLAELGQSLYTQGFDKINIAGNEEAKKVVQFYFDLAKEKVTVSPQNPSPNGWFGNDFTAAVLGMAQYGFWYSAMAEADPNRGSVMMLPGPTWSGQRRDPTMTATGMIMTSATQVPDAAWKVFEWYNGGQPSIDRAKSGWGVPALKSQMSMIPQSTEFQQQAYKVLQGELSLNTPPIQFNPFVGETVVPDSWNKNLDQALKGELTFDEMVANIEVEVNTSIKDSIDRIMG
jgi:multiple sugar transport system substrate-binding protein